MTSSQSASAREALRTTFPIYWSMASYSYGSGILYSSFSEAPTMYLEFLQGNLMQLLHFKYTDVSQSKA